MYLATNVERWAVQEMLDMFKFYTLGPSEFIRLHRQAELYSAVTNAEGAAIGAQFFQQVRARWCQQVQTTDDPVSRLLVAKELKDNYLQAYSYFHILKLTNKQIGDDRRLTTIDRLRLMNGSHNLRRYDPRKYNYQPSAEGDWSPQVYCSIQDKYDERSLWEMFDYSPMLQVNLSDLSVSRML
jgi:hypothetical protein